MVVNESAKYPEPDKDEVSNEARLQRLECHISALPRALPPQNAVLFCPLPGRVHHVKWWLAKFFVVNVDIFYMFADMGNDERTEMQLKFQDSPNPCVCNYTQIGRDRPQSHSSIPCGNNSIVLGIGRAAAGIYTGYPTGAKQSSLYMATEHWTQWLR